MDIKRCMKLLDSITYYVGKGRTTDETIRELLCMGYRPNELADEFNFAKEDVDKAVEYLTPDENKLTFKDLYDRIDFKSPYNLKHIKDSDWEIEISTFKGKNVRLFKRDTPNGNFTKQLVIYFTDNDEIEIYPLPGPKRMSVDGLITSWYEGTSIDADFGRQCADVLIDYIKAIRWGRRYINE